MLFKEIIAVYSENNTALEIVKIAETYNYH
jgi:hypothetical protein